MADKRANPSNYSMVTVSEGATLAGGDMVLSGEEDAYGHRKLGGIGELTAALIKERTGEDMIVQVIGYLMRSGAPDSLDLMVATNYAVMAADLALEGSSGRMVALRSGTYTSVPITATREGVKRVDVDELYDVRRVPAEGPSRHRQADVPVLSVAMRDRVLTAGGDCPGLNAVIRGVVAGAAQRHGVGGRRDPRRLGRPHGGPRAPLDRDAVRGILQRGGTILGTSRRDPYVHGEGSGSLRGTIERERDRRAHRGRRRRHAPHGAPALRGGRCRSWACRRRSTTTSPAPT